MTVSKNKLLILLSTQLILLIAGTFLLFTTFTPSVGYTRPVGVAIILLIASIALCIFNWKNLDTISNKVLISIFALVAALQIPDAIKRLWYLIANHIS